MFSLAIRVEKAYFRCIPFLSGARNVKYSTEACNPKSKRNLSILMKKTLH